MKLLSLFAGLIFTTTAFAVEFEDEVMKQYGYACKDVEVVIDSIVRDEHIAGHVRGLPTDAHKQFKVVFYVKTNRWYVHPYAYTSDQEGDGYSFTYLNSDGTFQIQSIRREVPAKQLAALLVPRKWSIKNESVRLYPLWGMFGGLTKGSCSHIVLRGNGDFLFE